MTNSSISSFPTRLFGDIVTRCLEARDNAPLHGELQHIKASEHHHYYPLPPAQPKRYRLPPHPTHPSTERVYKGALATPTPAADPHTAQHRKLKPSALCTRLK
ncbi:hypothetical protein E2C01_089068 [Portunus trituberculatus]|uniref:Uncharacterized protein n=1 Tax=Portunus trituberculatus TaxID=210409 RepID=A0A5B7JAZ8_PORTR|nr:hypothetical protein [Portunus trituberculatus]